MDILHLQKCNWTYNYVISAQKEVCTSVLDYRVSPTPSVPTHLHSLDFFPPKDDFFLITKARELVKIELL
jgi:hypothetical protein